MMAEIQKEKKENIRKYTEQFLSQCAPDLDARELLCQAYLELMETDASREGEIAAEQIISQMEEFYACYELSQEFPEDSDYIYLQYLTEGYSAEEKRKVLQDFLAGLQQMEGMGESVPHEVAELEREILSILQKHPFGEKASFGERGLTKAVSGELFTAMSAMIFYCMAVKGELGEELRELMPEQAVAIACRERILQEIEEDLQEGNIGKAVAEENRNAVDKTAIILLLAGVVFSKIFLVFYQKKITKVVEVIRQALREGRQIVPQTGEILLDLAEEQDLELSDVSLMLPYSIPVDESMLGQMPAEEMEQDILEEQTAVADLEQEQDLHL